MRRLEAEKALSLTGGGAERVAKQHAKGKLTARERVELFADAGTFRETDQLVTHRCADFGMEREHMPGVSFRMIAKLGGLLCPPVGEPAIVIEIAFASGTPAFRCLAGRRCYGKLSC